MDNDYRDRKHAKKPLKEFPLPRFPDKAPPSPPWGGDHGPGGGSPSRGDTDRIRKENQPENKQPKPPVKSLLDNIGRNSRSPPTPTPSFDTGLGQLGGHLSPIPHTSGLVTKTGDKHHLPGIGNDPKSVIVFGFDKKKTTTVLSMMNKYGDITKRVEGGNWIVLTYSTRLQAEQALRLNGEILDGDVMIGVVTASTVLQSGGAQHNTGIFEAGNQPASSGHHLRLPRGKYTQDRYPQKRKSTWENVVDFVFNW